MTIKVQNTIYMTPGALFTYGHWHTCRETFHGDLNNRKSFQFCCSDAKEKNKLITFMKKVQKKLKLKKDHYLAIKKTNKVNVIYILPKKWWRKQIRFSLLTILLRCGMNYKNDFKKALFSTKYTKTTRNAVNHFMSGYINYIGRKEMWHDAFAGKDKKYVKENLLK